MLRGSGSRREAPARPPAALPTRLAPFTPMLFQRGEFGEVTPFRFFAGRADRAPFERSGPRAVI